jgi:hypothetical protein
MRCLLVPSFTAFFLAANISILALADVAGQTVNFVWDPSPDADIQEYRLYYLEADNLLSGGMTTSQHPAGSVNDLVPGRTYVFYVTSVNSLGLESRPSNTVVYAVPGSLSELPNMSPVLADIPDQVVPQGSRLNLRVMATDAETPNSQLRFSLVEGPVGATLSTNGIFSWIAGELGTHEVVVQVMDSSSFPMFDTISFRVFVTEYKPGARPLPDLTSLNWITEVAPSKRLLFTGDLDFKDPTRSYYLQASENLKTWTTIKVVSYEDGIPDLIEDSSAAGAQMRFYRIIPRPTVKPNTF